MPPLDLPCKTISLFTPNIISHALMILVTVTKSNLFYGLFMLHLPLFASILEKIMSSSHALTANDIAHMSEHDWQNRLSPDEYYFLRQKGTERPFTGIYTDVFEADVYHCKGCHAKLFDSSSKFHSGCGWPSFDKTINDTP